MIAGGTNHASAPHLSPSFARLRRRKTSSGGDIDGTNRRRWSTRSENAKFRLLLVRRVRALRVRCCVRAGERSMRRVDGRAVVDRSPPPSSRPSAAAAATKTTIGVGAWCASVVAMRLLIPVRTPPPTFTVRGDEPKAEATAAAHCERELGSMTRVTRRRHVNARRPSNSKNAPSKCAAKKTAASAVCVTSAERRSVARAQRAAVARLIAIARA